MVRFSITIDMELDEIKEKYRQFFDEPKNRKVTKSDLASWIASLAQADIESVEQEDLDYQNIKP